MRMMLMVMMMMMKMLALLVMMRCQPLSDDLPFVVRDKKRE